MRDSIQHLNINRKIDKSIVTLNIDITSNNLTHPFSYDTIKLLIDKIETYSPKHIIFAIEPLDLVANTDEKLKIFNYLKSKKVYLNKFESSTLVGSIPFAKDAVFEKFPYFFEYLNCKDNGRYTTRRANLEYELKGKDETELALEKIGINTIPIERYEYTFNLLGTKQIFTKTSPTGTFGQYDSKLLLNNKINKDDFYNKTILIGHHDEYSMLAAPNIFNLINIDKHDYKSSFMPYHDIIANNINSRTTGDYIKLIQNKYGFFLITFFLIAIVVLNLKFKIKIFLFLSVIPAILLFNSTIYIIGSYYINIANAISYLIFLNYFMLPILWLSHHKQVEHEKMLAVNSARIDALLTVAEKVAHDIRSPLSAINLLTNSAEFSKPEYKNIVHSSIQRIDNIAESILKKYKNPNKADDFGFEKINLSDLIDKIIKEKKVLNISIKYNCVFEQCFAIGNAIELERVISNIYDNSIYALKNIVNAQINTEIIKNKDTCTIIITDNGIGISNAVLELIGTKRITTKSKLVGNGLGLLHAKKIVERMNGSLTIESTSKKFTRVSINLLSFD